MEILKSFSRPEEAMALLRIKFGGYESLRCDFESMSPTLRQCYEFLKQTCSSYVNITLALDKQLRDSNCICLIVLRALDTVEDDMTLSKEIKVPLLKSFYKNLLDPEWKFTESKDKNKIVLEQFPVISKEFRQLPDIYRDVITDITREMGEGMAKFSGRRINTMEEYEEYCHIAGSLTLIASTRLFSESGQENIGSEEMRLTDAFGIFAQKANVIKDFLEDWKEKRLLWPKAVWSKYVSDIGDFLKPENQAKAVACLNELVTNGLELLPETVSYVCRFKNPDIFRFAARFQLMAMANYVRCYNNPKMFSGDFEIKRDESLRKMMYATSTEKFKVILRHYILQIMNRIPDSDPSASKTRAVCQKALEATNTKQGDSISTIYSLVYMGTGLFLTVVAYTYWL